MTTTTWQEQRTAAIHGITQAVRTWIDDESITPDYFEYGSHLGIEYGDNDNFGEQVIDLINNRAKEMLDYLEKNQALPLPRDADGFPNPRIVDMCAYDVISRFSAQGDHAHTDRETWWGCALCVAEQQYSNVFQQLHQALYIELGFQAEVDARIAANNKAHEDAGCKHGEWDVTLQGYPGCIYTDPGLVTAE